MTTLRIFMALVLLVTGLGPGQSPAQSSPTQDQMAACLIQDDFGSCFDWDNPTAKPPSETADPSTSPIPYWVWYQITCLPWKGTASCNEGGYEYCGGEPGAGTVYALMRQDFIPPSPARRDGPPICVTDTETLGTPPRPDPVVRQNDLDNFQFAKPGIRAEPGPDTLIRFNTNFYTKKFDQTWDLNLLGKSVVVRAYPVEFRWDYGDGTTFVTDKPGRPRRMNEEDVPTGTSHPYQETGTYTVQLTTIYKAMYSVEGKPELPVDGQAEVVSEPVISDVWRVSIRNVDETCAENPDSWGCPGARP